MKCPQCPTPMRIVTYEGVHIHTCDGCGGEFVGPNELAAIVKARQTVFGSSLKHLFDDHKPMFGIPAGAVDRALRCPECGSAMRMVNYGGDSGIAVDRCDGCAGVWLDHDELEKAQLVMEHWQDRAPRALLAIASELEQARRKAAEDSSAKFAGSRFSFVNALINRLLEAA